MKTIFTVIILIFSQSSFGQLTDGSRIYVNDQIRMDITVTEGGWTLSSVTITELASGKIQKGTGFWHKINMQGVDDSYQGPDGFYEFSTDKCSYEFDAPNSPNVELVLSRHNCKNVNEKDKEYRLWFRFED